PTQLAELAEGVDRFEMRCGIEKPLVFVLPVQVDEGPASLAQRRARDERSIDEGAASSLRGDLPPDDQLFAVGRVENSFDDGLIFARPDEIGRGAAADDQPDG